MTLVNTDLFSPQLKSKDALVSCLVLLRRAVSVLYCCWLTHAAAGPGLGTRGAGLFVSRWSQFSALPTVTGKSLILVAPCIYIYKNVWTGDRTRVLGVRIRDSSHYPVWADKSFALTARINSAIRRMFTVNNYYLQLMDAIPLCQCEFPFVLRKQGILRVTTV